ncbi:hypothetical protein DO021_10305 [Desulfobacter hydrogenophilus]|uniref:Uncharacterized protein n=1 Tax=Desulfobacter hydrogenophilus TaxID=2291 RepID=A0A328FGR4_9BACT|nr:hypothetical protein [Desulfobacter hydrogenophilus]QBH15607.1 hypothetical protein EYB58_13935 [Desulfobacter hydrogenophilus]RAM02165.1 hypothetical protein DO021_10305 [Desulfobacter hydrogenophilus]
MGLFLLELEIFALAVMQSGKQSVLQVLDNQGDVIHETSGSNLSDFNRTNFEKVFGSLDQYTVRLHKHDAPFPFRAWFVAAICIPIGAMMLFAFVVKAYLVIFHGEKVDKMAAGDSGSVNEPDVESKLESTLNRIGRMNIFNIGFLVFIGVISYWIIPNMFTYLGQVGFDFFIQYEWVFFVLIGIVVCVCLWIVYLRYLLAKKSIQSHTELQKHRISLEYHAGSNQPLQLEGPSDTNQDIIDYKPEKTEETTPPS